VLRAQAKSLGLSPEEYARQLIEDGIRLQARARAESFDDLYAVAQDRFRASGMSEAALDQLVDSARTRHHQEIRRNARKRS
jgi:hypothetical protein